MGSQKSDCDPETGRCNCKTGFSGEKCQICPDGTLTNVTGCASGKIKTLDFLQN
jgi:hypothetical protein